jgi:hypothetical protein
MVQAVLEKMEGTNVEERQEVMVLLGSGKSREGQ